MNTIPPTIFLEEITQVKFTRAVCVFGMKIELFPTCGTVLPGTVALGLALVLLPRLKLTNRSNITATLRCITADTQSILIRRNFIFRTRSLRRWDSRTSSAERNPAAIAVEYAATWP